MQTFQEAIVNGWWQGIVLTLVVWAVLKNQVRISAATRLAIWQVTMLVVLALPLLQQISWPEPSGNSREAQRAPAPLSESTPISSIQPVASLPSRSEPLIELDNESLFEVLAVTGLIAAGLLLLRLAVGYWAVRQLKRKSLVCQVPLPGTLTRDARILLSSRTGMPLAVGFRNPAIILPERMVRALSEEQLEQVVLHEAAHLERKDDWFALGERILRAIFFIQPAMWFIGRQIERERELACDDWVVARSGEPKPYAEALARVAEVGTNGWTPILATGAGRRKEIFSRMEALLDQTRNKIPSASEPVVLAAALLLLFVVTQSTPFSHLLGFASFDSRSVVSDANQRKEFSVKGDVEFTDNEQDVLGMSPGSKLMISKSESWITRRVEIESDDEGKVVRRYFVGGVAQPYGSEAKRFLAKELPGWMKNQPKDLRARLERWIQAEGVEGALREVEDAINGDIKREYLEQLFRSTSLDNVQTRRWLRIASQLDSDENKERLIELAEQQARTLGLDSALMETIQKIHSEDRRSSLIERSLREATAAAIPRLLQAIGTIHSDHQKMALMETLAKEYKGELPASYFEIAGSIHSEENRKQVLVSALEYHGKEAGTQSQVVTQARNIHSHEGKHEIVMAVLKQEPLAPEAIADARKVVNQIHSKESREELLKELNSR